MAMYNCPHCQKVFETASDDVQIVVCPHCNKTVSILGEKDLEPGTKISGFEIIRLLGKGGMGNVYLANQISMDRPIALKVLPKILTTNKEEIEQFIKEAKMTGRLEHPNIVTAIDAGEENGTYFLATTFVDGETLETQIEKKKSISELQALKYTLKIAEALTYAWDKHQLLHKDIKPGNIIINQDDDAYLLDMGIAQRIGDIEEVKKDHVEGSPFYMSPEQTRNESLGWSSDLYSLGATLYHLVVGVPPYDAPEIMKIVEMHTTEPFPSPKKRNSKAKISPHTVDLLKKMMAKTPKERFRDWQKFQKDLKKVIKKVKADKKAEGVKKTTTIQNVSFKKPHIVREKKSGLYTLYILAIVAVIAIVLGVGIKKFVRSSRASDALRNAQEYYNDNKCEDLTEALRLFDIAKKSAQGTGYEVEATETYNEIKIQLDRRKKIEENFDRQFNKASKLFAAKKYKDAIRLFKQIKRIHDKKRNRRLRQSLKNTIAVMEKHEAKKEHEEFLKEQEKEQQEFLKEQQEEKRREKLVAKLRKKLTAKKQPILLRIAKLCRRKDFDDALKAIKSRKESKKNEEFLNVEVDSFNEWNNNYISHIINARKAWELVYDSGKALKGTSLKIPELPDVKVEKIKAKGVYLKIKNKQLIKTTLDTVPPKEILKLMKKATKKSKNKHILFSYFMLSCDFEIANKLTNDEDRHCLSEMIHAILFPKIKNALQQMSENKEKGEKALKSLEKTYGKLPEFKQILSELTSKNKDG